MYYLLFSLFEDIINEKVLKILIILILMINEQQIGGLDNIDSESLDS